ncbi:hypothetical protein HKX48_003033 [Thoreauomyces humboldtii]|nr:hypothetical protein HKX48_003033 [Thoreauomyces humboldtii]
MVIATIQHITLNFYHLMRLGTVPVAYKGYNSPVNTAIDLAFSNVGLRYGHSALNSLVLRYDANGQVFKNGPLVMEEVFLEDQTPFLLSDGIESIIRGFPTQPEQNVDGRYAPVVRNKMPIEHPHYDLVAIDIQRGREMGMADYLTLRVAYGLPVVTRWGDVSSDETLVTQLKLLCPNMTTPNVLTAEELLKVKANGTLGMLIKMNTNITVFPDNPFTVTTPDSVLGAQLTKLSDALSNSIIVTGIMKLSWSIDVDQINFAVETDASCWVGFGFGKNMLPADIYLFRHDTAAGTWTCQDSWSKDLEVPKPDTAYGGALSVLDFAIVPSHIYAHKMTFSRALNTGNPYDVAITRDDMQMIFATSGTVSPSYHGVKGRQHAMVNFYTGATAMNSETAGLYRLNVFHGFA